MVSLLAKRYVLKGNVIVVLCLVVLSILIGYLGLISQPSQDQAIESKDSSVHPINLKDMPALLIEVEDLDISGLSFDQALMTIYEDGLSSQVLLESSIGIRIRGKSSRSYPKKQYRIELWDENMEDYDAEILGLSKESDWILAGPFKDKSLIRNSLAYHIGGEVMGYAPRTIYCEVYVKEKGQTLGPNSYKGVYLVIENIKRSDDRVAIYPAYEGRKDTSFILNKDVPGLSDVVINTYGKETLYYPKHLEVVYPENTSTPDQLTYMTRYISELERVLLSYDYDSEDGYSQYIDVDSFVDYYILNEFFRNTDAGIFSTYLYKDYGEKVHIGPIWDFNEALGNNPDFGGYYDYTGFYINTNFWYKRLMEDRRFVNKVVNRYGDLRKTYLSDDYLYQVIDENVEVLSGVIPSNFERWPWDVCSKAELFETVSSHYFRLSADEARTNEDLREDQHHYINQVRDVSFGADHLLDFVNQSSQDGIYNTTVDYEDEINQMKIFIKNRGFWMDQNIKLLLKFTE